MFALALLLAIAAADTTTSRDVTVAPGETLDATVSGSAPAVVAVVRIPGAGQYIQEEQPDAVIRAVRALARR